MNDQAQAPVPQKKGGKGGIVFGVVNLLLIIGLGIALAVVGVLLYSRISKDSGQELAFTGGGADLSEMYKKVNPSVVYLFNKDVKLALDEYGQIKYQTAASLGSGVIYDSDGYIITNAHVIADELGTKVFSSVQVVFPETNEVNVAEVLAADPLNDIAIVKIRERSLPTSEFGNMKDVKIGDSVFAVGSPGGANDIVANLKNTMTAGIVSGLNRSFGVIGVGDALSLQGEIPETIPSLAHNDLIQTDAAINHGNSGGPLYNIDGKIIGINTLVERTQGQEGMGFAVPVDTVKRIADEVKETGKLTAPYVGVATLSIDKASAQMYGFKEDEGAMVYLILPNSPAANSKLQPLDVITGFNGQKVTSASDFDEMLLGVKAGDEVTLDVNSQGAKNTVKIKTIETPFLKGL
ncbi:trypsin-like peptidase domain-containing protein [Patescibacteria group bacterium]|nr:trypsin-like peptidase domain-containing protein [Patescibacteria group bacterium]